MISTLTGSGAAGRGVRAARLPWQGGFMLMCPEERLMSFARCKEGVRYSCEILPVNQGSFLNTEIILTFLLSPWELIFSLFSSEWKCHLLDK